MKNEVNKRIVALRSELNLTVLEFCNKAGISTATYVNIPNGETVSEKTLKRISEGLNVNKEWLLTGKGEKFSTPKFVELEFNPYKDALVSELKGQVAYLQDMLKLALSGKAPANFRKGLAHIGLLVNRRELNPAINFKN